MGGSFDCDRTSAKIGDTGDSNSANEGDNGARNVVLYTVVLTYGCGVMKTASAMVRFCSIVLGTSVGFCKFKAAGSGEKKFCDACD
jgi:hypothetical protein